MSPKPRNEGGPGGEARDELADLLIAGLERDVNDPVDTARLLEGARSGAGRLRRRRTVTGAAVAVLVVAGLPLAALQLRALDHGPGVRPAPTASFGEQPAATTAAPPPRLAHVVVPSEALVSGADLGIRGLVAVGAPMQKDHIPTTGEVVCAGQPGGLQYTLGGVIAQYDQGNLTRDGWALTASARALTLEGAQAEMRYLDHHLDTCDSKVGAHWNRQIAPVFPGDSSAVLAYAPDDGTTTGSLAVVGVVRMGPATSGFWLHVPVSAGPNPAARLTTALRSGRTLLDAAAGRLQSSGLPETAATLPVLGGRDLIRP